MSALFPQLVRAVASGAAMETGRAAARRNGLGFAQGDYYDFDGWGGYGFDDWGNYYEYDWFSGGGGDYYDGGWPSFEPFTVPDLTSPISPSANDERYWFDWGSYLSDWLSGNVDRVDTYAQGSRDPFGSGSWPGTPDWLPGIGPGPAQVDPLYGPAGDGSRLPGYCPQGTYHPVSDPFACVPFPPNDPNAKRPAQQQRNNAQQAAQAARKAQQQADKQCPKDPQGRPVWRNPQTGKCELAPACPPGAKFDSASRRCLTPAQAKELYGESNWWIWALIGGGALLLMNRDSGGSGGRRR
ncbi:MAG: hypothetical protein ACKVZH_06775 [Blastocatellia bacterium]